MRHHLPPRFFGALLLGLLAAHSARADDDDGTPLFRMVGTTPAGFEVLAAAQTALVDVYYADRPLLSTMATFTTDSITFDTPDALLGAIPDLADPESVRPVLTAPLRTNAQELCIGRGQRDCGSLAPEVAGVIFNADRYRVDLFVSGDYRIRGEPPRRKFLEPSRSDSSFVQNFTGNFAGTSRGSDGITVSSFSTFAHRENRVVATASYSDVDQLTVDRLFARRDFEGMQYVGGLFRTSGRVPSFNGENDLLGLRMASSLETRTDLNQSRGTPIDLFLSSRSRVDIVKDGRLLSTRFYDAGNQILDTTMLPEGAYEITIRITENGSVREETQFFTKTSRIPPKDQALFTLEAGEVMRRNTSALFPEDTGAFLVRGGYSNRLTDSFGIDAGLAGTSEDQMLETGFFLIDTLPGTRDAFYEFQATVFGSVEGDYGFGLNGFMRWNRFSINFDARQVNKKHDPLPGLEDEYRLIPEDLEQASVSLQIPFWRGSLGISASENRRSNAARRSSRSVNVRYPLAKTRLGLFELRGDVSQTNGDYAAFLSLRLNFWRDNWSGDVAPSYQYADDNLAIEDGFRVDGSTAWHDQDSRIGDVRLSGNGSVGQNTNRLGSSMDWKHFLGRTLASVDHVDRDGQGTTNYGVSFNTSMLTDGESWTFGGQNTTNSAVVIDLDGEAPETDFEVLINGFRRGYAPAGRSTAIHLAPFRTYEVRIAPRRSNFVSFKDRIEEITLYPGNVTRLNWEVADLLVVVGRVRDADGSPLANAVVDNAVGFASTDELGYFQAEVLRSKSAEGVLLEFSDARGSCRVLVPEFEERVGVGFLDTLTCRRVQER